MIEMYKTEGIVLYDIKKYEPGCWINMIHPSHFELQQIAEDFHIQPMDLSAALDEEESSRLMMEEGYILILVDIPSLDEHRSSKHFITLPLGMILCEDVIITICREETSILEHFAKNRERDFSTRKPLRFVYQILFQTAILYQSYLRSIDKERRSIEDNVIEESDTADLISLHRLESSLVYFATSLRANESVLERLNRHARIKRYPEDKDLLEDVIVENKQAIEMTSIYKDILSGTRDLLSSLSDNRLNNVMKYLTSITLVMAIPTIISGFYGMNVEPGSMPLSTNPHGFDIICIGTAVLCVIVMIILQRRRML